MSKEKDVLDDLLVWSDKVNEMMMLSAEGKCPQGLKMALFGYMYKEFRKQIIEDGRETKLKIEDMFIEKFVEKAGTIIKCKSEVKNDN